MAGIYVHVPFCKQACHYCNFFFTTSVKSLHETVSSLQTELSLRADYLDGELIETIYFGGGTPTMLAPNQLQQIISRIYEIYEVSKEVEITVEANPENLTSTYLLELQKTAVNRFSIGIQSFYEDELIWMNRAHNAEEAINCVKLCREYGYNNFSLDLIFGVPISSNARWESNLEKALELEPHHLSCYGLTVEEGTALHNHVQRGKSPNVIDEAIQNQFFIAHDRLQKAGYIHYETSNYALKGHESKHNSSYWKGKKYLGIGPGAHSYNLDSRSWNIAHLPKYLDGILHMKPKIELEVLSEVDKYNEFVMTSIRRNSGIDVDVIRSSYGLFYEHFVEALEHVPSQYIEIKDNCIVLSRDGLVFADFVGSELFMVNN